MPKVEKKLLTEPFYVYLKPINDKFVRGECDKLAVANSFYIDEVISQIRSGKLKPKVVKPLTVVEKRRLEKEKKLRDNERRRTKRKQGDHTQMSA